MKKFLVFLAAAVLICSFSLTAFAADNVVLLNFDSATDAKTYMGSAEDFMTSQYGTATPEYSSVTGAVGNAVKVSMGITTTTVYTGVIGDAAAIAAFTENCESKQYMRFYFENASANADLILSLNFRGDGGNKYVNAAADTLKFFDSAEKAYTVAAYGDPSGGAAGENRNFGAVIPAGFKGWVYFKMDNSKLDALTGWSKTALGALTEVENIEIDVRCYDAKSDASIAFVLDALELTDELLEPAGDTADFSVIAYALAAVTGCGALFVTRKRAN